MNKLLILFFWSAICFGCKNNVTDEKKELTGEEKELIKLDNVSYELKEQKEKIVLLATIKGLPYDTLYSILKDYYYVLDGNSNNDTLIINAINYTKEKHILSKSKIASLVFSFKYEMLTKDEIFENEFQENSPIPDN